MDYSLINNHPDVDEIITKLVTGTAPKTVADWLKLKYSRDDQDHLRLSEKLLQSFQNSPFLDFYQQAEQDLIKTKNNQPLDKKIAQSLLNNKSYKERLNEIIDQKIETEMVFKQMHVVFLTRIEQIFDKIQEDPGMVRKDIEGALAKYLELWMGFIEKYEKLVNNRPDQVIQHNHIITYYDQYIDTFKQAIMDVFAEVDPNIAFILMEKIDKKLSFLQPPQLPEQEVITEKKLLAEAKNLQSKLGS